jgi:hypothetical protein
MAKPNLSSLIEAARASDAPSIPPPSSPVLGGVDPLGLRQVNFEMMDQVLPGINNVGRHVRPYVVTTWACRRAAALADEAGLNQVDIRDFVDRIEVIYAWSQFLRSGAIDLPGRQSLDHIVTAAEFTFGGDAWKQLRLARRYSTSFTAPIQYGPALKNLGWVAPHATRPEALIALPEVTPALDAFEAEIADLLDHPAFSSLDEVTVLREEALAWGDAWDLYKPTAEEQRICSELLFGRLARRDRRDGIELMLLAVEYTGSFDTASIRKALSGAPTNFVSPDGLAEAAVAWRRLQVRQLFRFALEAFFYWIGQQLLDGAKSTGELVDEFLASIGGAEEATAGAWLSYLARPGFGPTDHIDAIQASLANNEREAIPLAIANGLAFALTEAPSDGQRFERQDRLPLHRAKQEANRFGGLATRALLRHIIECWILAQHVYWSVGRGLADARSRGKQILRLKVVLEEQGWELAPGTTPPPKPFPTPDRLLTALTLAQECGATSVTH